MVLQSSLPGQHKQQVQLPFGPVFERINAKGELDAKIKNGSTVLKVPSAGSLPSPSSILGRYESSASSSSSGSSFDTGISSFQSERNATSLLQLFDRINVFDESKHTRLSPQKQSQPPSPGSHLDPAAPSIPPQQVPLPQVVVSPPLPTVMSPSLERLLTAARHCSLPPSTRSPEPGTPNYPSIMLCVSSTLLPKMQRSNWCLDDYLLGDKLYTGYSSTVYKAYCKVSGALVVLKVYTLAKVCDLYKFQIYREVRLHASLQHENIIHLYASFQEGDNVVMVEEYCDGSDLFSIMQKHGGRLTERMAVQLVLDPFLRVMQFLHSRGIAHRDIKPENIMFTKDMVLKLGDFGLAINMSEERGVTRAGTLDYMPPEVLKCPFKAHPEENKSNEALTYSCALVDSWALGVLSYELVVGFPPFYDHQRNGTEDRINNRDPAFPDFMSSNARSFVLLALKKTPVERPTIMQMLNHTWIDSLRPPLLSCKPAAVNPCSTSPGTLPAHEEADTAIKQYLQPQPAIDSAPPTPIPCTPTHLPALLGPDGAVVYSPAESPAAKSSLVKAASLSLMLASSILCAFTSPRAATEAPAAELSQGHSVIPMEALLASSCSGELPQGGCVVNVPAAASKTAAPPPVQLMARSSKGNAGGLHCFE